MPFADPRMLNWRGKMLLLDAMQSADSIPHEHSRFRQSTARRQSRPAEKRGGKPSAEALGESFRNQQADRLDVKRLGFEIRLTIRCSCTDFEV